MSKKKTGLFAIVLACLILTAYQPAYAEAPWLIRLGLDFGGDDLIEVQFSDGETDKIKAGGLVYVEAGKQVRVPGLSDVSAELTLGYKADSVNATNGSISFRRFILAAVSYYRATEKLSLGAGVSYHLNPTLKIDVPGVDTDIDADNALGLVLLADYTVSERASLGLRATLIDYDGDDLQKASGDSLGVYITRYF